MVKLTATIIRKVIVFILSIAILAFFLSACGTVPKVSIQTDLKHSTGVETVYILPFSATLVPSDIQETIFNDFVDILNENRARTGVGQFEIIKEQLAEVDKSWLAKQSYLSGELWSFVINSGCCRTELRIRSRISLTEPGKEKPTFEVMQPAEGFFDHDQSTLDKEKLKLSRELARNLADSLINAFSSR